MIILVQEVYIEQGPWAQNQSPKWGKGWGPGGGVSYKAVTWL